MSTVTITAEVKKEAQGAEALAKSLNGFTITSSEHYENAATVLKEIKAKANSLDETRKSITRPIDDAKKKVMEFFSKPLEFLAQADRSVRQAMIAWKAEQDRIADEERRKAEEQRREQEAALLKKQQEAEAKGKAKAVEKLQQELEDMKETPLPITRPAAPKVAGTQYRTIWKFKVVDENKIPRSYMCPDEEKITQFVRETKGSVPMDGIEIYSEQILAVGR